MNYTLTGVKVGDTLMLRARNYGREITVQEVTVKSVGRKYITIVEGSSGYGQDRRFYISDGREKVDYGYADMLYTPKAYADRERRIDALNILEAMGMQIRGSRLTTGQLCRMALIVQEGTV